MPESNPKRHRSKFKHPCACGCGAMVREKWKRGHARRQSGDLFWNRVTKGVGCWQWTGPKDRGYGIIIFNGHRVRAHRYSYELHFGASPGRLFVCHRCDNPSCVRPDHLFLGTQLDNMQDMARKGRHWRKNHPEWAYHGPMPHPERCARGERHGRAKVNAELVRAFRRDVAAGETRVAVAKKYGVHRAIVYSVISGKTWAHVA